MQTRYCYFTLNKEKQTKQPSPLKQFGLQRTKGKQLRNPKKLQLQTIHLLLPKTNQLKLNRDFNFIESPLRQRRKISLNDTLEFSPNIRKTALSQNTDCFQKKQIVLSELFTQDFKLNKWTINESSSDLNI